MCGIFGFIDKNATRNTCTIMSESLAHRGPDSNGNYFNIENGYCVGNTRLSIIDINDGNQPFFSNDNKIIVVQNGEIYNYLEVKNELLNLGTIFFTNSDTEVILKAYETWGPDFISKLNGMFAIAIIDEHKGKLYLYRDRLGVKPLYLFCNHKSIYFSSEIKSFLKIRCFDKQINTQAITDYLTFNYIPIPQTIFKNVSHLEPGSFLEIDLVNIEVKKTHKYWNYIDFFEKNKNITDEEILFNIEGIIYDATKIRLRSDVEVGAFLSGGLDSSIVCAIMREVYPDKKIPVYSIGFNDHKYDEVKYAKYVSRKYNLKQKIKYLGDDIINNWPKTTFHCDQPHGDTSFIPTNLLAKEAAKYNKVVLSGDGGDELFGGYEKYSDLENMTLSKYFEKNSVFNEHELESIIRGEFFKKINPKNHLEVIRNNTSENLDAINNALFFDVKQLFPGNNLVKPDKMAMMHSLEVRSPFLDYRLYELLGGVEGERKIRNGELKYYLKVISKKHFDNNHIYRKKQMFTVPMGDWFKNELKNYGESILFDGKLESREIFNMIALNKMWHEHINGTLNHTRKLRAIMNLEIWFRNFYENE